MRHSLVLATWSSALQLGVNCVRIVSGGANSDTLTRGLPLLFACRLLSLVHACDDCVEIAFSILCRLSSSQTTISCDVHGRMPELLRDNPSGWQWSQLLRPHVRLSMSSLSSLSAKIVRYDENPACLFDEGREHFAIHVRMGDRRAFYDGNPEYFELLETIMSIFTQELRGRGLRDPLFHVFSETLIPCPSEATGHFEEFPTWPVELDEVRSPFIQHRHTYPRKHGFAMMRVSYPNLPKWYPPDARSAQTLYSCSHPGHKLSFVRPFISCSQDFWIRRCWLYFPLKYPRIGQHVVRGHRIIFQESGKQVFAEHAKRQGGQENQDVRMCEDEEIPVERL